MKSFILLVIVASLASVVISQEVNYDREKKIICENKFNYNIKWAKRYCAAKVLDGDLTDVNSTLPEKYVSIFGDKVPRESLVTRDAYRDWICGDINSRWEENTKGTVDETTLHCSHATAEHKKCVMSENIKMINEEVCQKKSKLASDLAKGFLGCLKTHIGEDKECWKQKITQELNNENLENWMCIAPDNISNMYQTVYCESNQQKRGELLKCIKTAYNTMEI